MILLFMTSVIAFAGAIKENCGCGLGTLLFKEEAGISQQVLAATTNAITGTQTFGISSGTLECNQPSTWVSNEKLNNFVADNMDNLAKDAAMGQGEYVDTLAELMAISVSRRAEFLQMLQDNFSSIFNEASVSHADVIEKIAHLM
jgi:hypothetical protein